jgi:hypothetical protein
VSRTRGAFRQRGRQAAALSVLLAFALAACGGSPKTRIGATPGASTPTPSAVTNPSPGSSTTIPAQGATSSSPPKKVSDIRAPQVSKVTACSVLTQALATEALGAEATPDTTATSPVPGTGACSYLASAGARVTLLLVNEPVAVKAGLGKPSDLLSQSCTSAGFTLTQVPDVAAGAVQCANGTKTRAISQEDVAWEAGDLGLTIEIDDAASTGGIAKEAAVDLAKKLTH